MHLQLQQGYVGVSGLLVDNDGYHRNDIGYRQDEIEL